jgi:hypothetical protein
MSENAGCMRPNSKSAAAGKRIFGLIKVGKALSPKIIFILQTKSLFEIASGKRRFRLL